MIHAKAGWRALAGTIVLLTSLAAFQRPFREFPGNEYNDFPLPRDWQDKSEWTFARLMYPPSPYGRRGFRGRYNGDWTQGRSSWTTDYPRSDRHFSEAMRRLTRVHSRSVEQPVNLDEGDAYDWPFLYGVEVGHWQLTDAQAKAMREFLDRGGFFMCDDFHGVQEWEIFAESMRRVFPDRQIVDIENGDTIFHTIYDLDDKFQVPGWSPWSRGHQTSENGGVDPKWRGIYDDKGRLVVAICHNMDLGDSWEHADNPQYPEKFSALGIRIGINYVVYSMTH
ncbi:MAG: hypothetical protein JWP63_3506 [Candidatus Solibacter sp.]|nr:hypothetical protein [Candidatus Solibacter sp.]